MWVCDTRTSTRWDLLISPIHESDRRVEPKISVFSTVRSCWKIVIARASFESAFTNCIRRPLCVSDSKPAFPVLVSDWIRSELKMGRYDSSSIHTRVFFFRSSFTLGLMLGVAGEVIHHTSTDTYNIVFFVEAALPTKTLHSSCSESTGGSISSCEHAPTGSNRSCCMTRRPARIL